MPAAANALKQWLTETEPPTKLLDVSYCSRPGSHAIPPPVTTAGAAYEAVSLEPTPGQVTIHESKKKPGSTHTTSTSIRSKASPEGKFVYDMAFDLRKNHNMPWGKAISMAENVWKHSPKSDIKAIADAEKSDSRGEVTEDGIVMPSDDDGEFEVLTEDIIR